LTNRNGRDARRSSLWTVYEAFARVVDETQTFAAFEKTLSRTARALFWRDGFGPVMLIMFGLVIPSRPTDVPVGTNAKRLAESTSLPFCGANH
jgi:hypothetical protein